VSPSSSSTSLVLSCTHARTPQAGPRRQHRSCNARARSRLPLWVVVVSCLHRTPLFPFVFLRQFDLFSSELSHYPVSRQKPRRSHPVNSSHVRRNQASLLLRIHPSNQRPNSLATKFHPCNLPLWLFKVMRVPFLDKS
jgi:hypothetical protein